MKGFYPMNAKLLEFDVNDILRIKFNHYIMRKENIQRMKKTYQSGILKTSQRTIAQDLNISQNTARRLLIEFEDLGIICCINKSKNSESCSIYKYIFWVL